MFQTYDVITNPSLALPRLNALRALMAKRKLDAYLVPRADEHQGEYVPACAERLKWLTGFSGSAGLAIVAARRAVVFIDGRYTVQARAELDPALFETARIPVARPEDWLAEALPHGAIIGFDPWLMTLRGFEQLSAALGAHGLKLKPVAGNLVDRAWDGDRPPAPMAPVVPHPLACSGETAEAKLARIQDILKRDDQDAVVLTLPDSICWLLNIRGGDIPHTPVALAFAIVPRRGKVEVFIDRDKLGKAVRDHLKPVARLHPPLAFADRLAELRAEGRTVRVDPATAAYAITRTLGGARGIARGADPVIALKAVKNTTEIAGTRAAHLRDGAAVANFLCWLDREAPTGHLTEIAAARRLEAVRAATGALKEISFDTIAGSGPNGAIVHYRVNEQTDRSIEPGELFLIDSGAQYEDGTTDITRTVAIGKPTPDMVRAFTLVLKGHIAIATARFPKGTRGVDLDSFARRALWQAGLDYDHGTGHGVGSYLSVHEGPASISKAGMVPLEAGMILSNEPGYYREGAFGIRIENLVLVTEPAVPEGGERAMLGFETLTLCPIDRRLIEADMLTSSERAWLDAYHARVLRALQPLLEAPTRAWLEDACAGL